MHFLKKKQILHLLTVGSSMTVLAEWLSVLALADKLTSHPDFFSHFIRPQHSYWVV